MRIDTYLLSKNYFSSRAKAQQAIERGEVFLNGKAINKSAFNVDEDMLDKVEIISNSTYVSLGGYKLEKALKDFEFDVEKLVCADIGASKGGFTDCLLQNGAKKVYAVDLNNQLLDKSLKDNKKVIEIIKNARYLTKQDFDENIDLIVADLSFISEKMILPVLYNIIEEGKFLIVLIKPQFEVDKKVKFKNGIIKDNKVLIDAIFNVYNCGKELGLVPVKVTYAPINQQKNREFLILFKKGEGTPCEINLKKLRIT